MPLISQQGHLLVLENFHSLQLNHGLMEVGYADYQNLISTSELDDHDQKLSVSMTATMDTMGNLILGNILHLLLSILNASF